jgi:hypothetical protein
MFQEEPAYILQQIIGKTKWLPKYLDNLMPQTLTAETHTDLRTEQMATIQFRLKM